MSQKRVLITGAAGFLGSHLCDRFIKEGFYVIGMDNLITGDEKNIAHLIANPNFEFKHHDITNFIKIDGSLDYILNFASPASPIDYLKIPIQTLKVGSLGALNCLGLAKAKGARILVASTSEVYGDPLVHPQIEEYWGNVNSVGPRSVYDEAKRFMESVTMAYHTFHNVEIRIVRIFNTYGPRMRLNDGRALPAFIGQALRGEDLTIFGDGLQTREGKFFFREIGRCASPRCVRIAIGTAIQHAQAVADRHIRGVIAIPVIRQIIIAIDAHGANTIAAPVTGSPSAPAMRTRPSSLSRCRLARWASR